ncbi:hypothetical protein TNCT_238541 [Trichonephila clavata]|uniref:Uncharacterized protein n=1 Tax=Trichonephila clavata TaxID=2740835 RepID=A0A8X6L049_TRICU|nr:hypothetical protein TNCT_238541 [Trichonephila clavata]
MAENRDSIHFIPTARIRALCVTTDNTPISDRNGHGERAQNIGTTYPNEETTSMEPEDRTHCEKINYFKTRNETNFRSLKLKNKYLNV